MSFRPPSLVSDANGAPYNCKLQTIDHANRRSSIFNRDLFDQEYSPLIFSGISRQGPPCVTSLNPYAWYRPDIGESQPSRSDFYKNYFKTAHPKSVKFAGILTDNQIDAPIRSFLPASAIFSCSVATNGHHDPAKPQHNCFIIGDIIIIDVYKMRYGSHKSKKTADYVELASLHEILSSEKEVHDWLKHSQHRDLVVGVAKSNNDATPGFVTASFIDISIFTARSARK